MYFGSSGLSLGDTFKVTSSGALTATSGSIGGFSLASNKLTSSDLLISSDASTQTQYTPTGVSTVSNSSFISSVTTTNVTRDYFGAPSQDAWACSYTGTGTTINWSSSDYGYVEFYINDVAATYAEVWQHFSASGLTGKSLTVEFSFQHASTPDQIIAGYNIDMEVWVKNTSGQESMVAKNTIDSGDITNGVTSYAVEAFIPSDTSEIAYVIAFPYQNTSADYQYRKFRCTAVTADEYDRTQVTLNNTGLKIWSSPNNYMTMNSVTGFDFRVTQFRVQNIMLGFKTDTGSSSLPYPDEGFASFSVRKVAGNMRLYVRDDEGGYHYVNMTSL